MSIADPTMNMQRSIGVDYQLSIIVLTLVMPYEKTEKGGEPGVAPIRFGLVVLGGVLVLLDPAWMPALPEVS